jgi:hypothetical protein
MASISFFTFSFSTFVEVNDFPIMLSDDNQENTQTKCKMHISTYISPDIAGLSIADINKNESLLVVVHYDPLELQRHRCREGCHFAMMFTPILVQHSVLLPLQNKDIQLYDVVASMAGLLRSEEFIKIYVLFA